MPVISRESMYTRHLSGSTHASYYSEITWNPHVLVIITESHVSVISNSGRWGTYQLSSVLRIYREPNVFVIFLGSPCGSGKMTNTLDS
jgi:hypothetical protein